MSVPISETIRRLMEAQNVRADCQTDVQYENLIYCATYSFYAGAVKTPEEAVELTVSVFRKLDPSYQGRWSIDAGNQ